MSIKNLRLWLPALLWMGLIFLGSSVPDAVISQTGWLDFILRKAIHLFEYGVLAVLLYNALPSSHSRTPPIPQPLGLDPFNPKGFPRRGGKILKPLEPTRGRRVQDDKLLVAFLFTLAYAITDEFHQTFVPGRTGIWTDVLVDGVGAALGLWLWSKSSSTLSQPLGLKKKKP